jgi:hypothetical protein
MTEAELIEKMAEAIYCKRNGHGCVPWSRLHRDHKTPYIGDARAAHAAIREAGMLGAAVQDREAGCVEITLRDAKSYRRSGYAAELIFDMDNHEVIGACVWDNRAMIAASKGE